VNEVYVFAPHPLRLQKHLLRLRKVLKIIETYSHHADWKL